MAVWCLLAVAWGEPVSEAERVTQHYLSMKDLEVVTDLYRGIEEPVTLKQGDSAIRLNTGYLFPVFSGHFSGEWDREWKRILARLNADEDVEVTLPTADERGDKELVGFVWTQGTGFLSTRLKDRADALVFGNMMVSMGQDKAAFTDIAHGDKPFVTAIEEGVFLSISPELESVYLGPQADEEASVFEVVVFGDRKEAREAGRRASALFAQRQERWEQAGFEPDEHLAWDRVLETRRHGDPNGSFSLADVNTAHEYSFDEFSRGPVKSWLAVIRDDTGRVDPRRQFTVASVGVGVQDQVTWTRIGGTPFPPMDADDPLSPPLPRVRVEIAHAEGHIWAQEVGNDLAVKVQTTLKLTARGGPADTFELMIPRTEQRKGSWKVTEARVKDGETLIGIDKLVEWRGGALADEGETADPDAGHQPKPGIDPASPKPEPGTDPARPKPVPIPMPPPSPIDEEEELTSGVRIILPQTLAQDASVEIVVVYEDTWPYVTWSGCWATGTRPAGASSGLRAWMPYPANGRPGGPAPFRVTAWVPDERKVDVALGGKTLAEGEKDGWRFVTAAYEGHSAVWPHVAFGKWHAVVDPPYQDLPGVRVHLFTGREAELTTFAPETRRVIGYLQRWLPAFPVDEIEIFEAPAGCYGLVYVAPHGMVNVQRAVVTNAVTATGPSPSALRQDRPHLENGVFAHELAHQWWGHTAQPGSSEDQWIAETFAEAYSCMYVGAAFEPKACEVRMEAARDDWERYAGPTVRSSLAGAYESRKQASIVYGYGPYVFNEMLRRRIGKEAYFGALDLFLMDHAQEPVTTEQLERYFSLASGRDLSDYFDFWVYAGFVPNLSLSWSLDKKAGISGTIESDVPFGTFDVPVQIEDDEGVREIWVTVVDGTGTLPATPVKGKLPKVKLDPTGMVMARSRTIE